MDKGAVILRFTDGILDREKYMLLKIKASTNQMICSKLLFVNMFLKFLYKFASKK